MRTVTVALNLPKTIAGTIIKARFIATQMDGNPYFPSPPVPIATLWTLLRELELAKTSKARKAKLVDIVNALHAEKAHVQGIAREYAPEFGLVVAVSSGMDVKEWAGQRKWLFWVEQGAVSGTVELGAPRPKRGSSFEWQWSADGVLWIDHGGSNKASTRIEHLTPGSRYYFRYRTLTDDVFSNWSDAITFRVS